jgi:hypothetical protein
LFSIQSTRAESNSGFFFPQENSNTSEILQELSIREQINAKSLIDQGYNGSGIKIGIIDTGINGSHSEFQNKEVIAKSFVTVDNGYSGDHLSTVDNIGHGTKVAGLAIGKTLGIAPGAQAVSAKIFEQGVRGNAGFIEEETSEAIAEAITWLIEKQNVSIINFSLSQYHNLLNEGREWIINKYSLERNVIFVVAASNTGKTGINLGSLGNPSTSLQAITVGASSGVDSMADFSANGPRVDWVMKPDLVAPGVNLIGPSHINSNNSFCSGTSCSTPVVSGAIAVLLSALQKNNIKYTVGTIKGALIATSNPIENKQAGEPYPWWQQGSGLIDVEKAYDYISNSLDPIIRESEFVVPYPENLPFKPLNKLFQGQSIGFNLSIIASRQYSGEISVHNDNFNFISVINNKDFQDTTLLAIWINIPKDAPEGFYNIDLEVRIEEIQNILIVPINFFVCKPVLNILFDETHNGLVNQVTGLNDRFETVADPWGDSNFLFGSFFDFFMTMVSNNVSITPFRSGRLDNLTYLEHFDTLILPFPATKLTGIFTDWWNDLENFPESTLTNSILSFTEKELRNIKDFLIKKNKNLVIFTSYPDMHDLTELNKLLNLFNISYVDNANLQELVFTSEDESNKLVQDVNSITYIGGALKGESNYEGVLWGKLPGDNMFGFANWHVEGGGNLFVSGTGHFAENFGLNSANPSLKSSHEHFLINIITHVSESGTNPVPSGYTVNSTNSFTILDLTTSAFIIGTIIITYRYLRRKK